MYSRLLLYRYSNGDFRLVNCPISFNKNYRRSRFSINSNEEKLANNIVRARSNVFNYVMNNDFKYYVTLTVNQSHDRGDIDWLRRSFSQIVRDLRRSEFGDFFYLIIPEKHKDGNFHLHGFLSSAFGCDFYYNDHNYLSWRSFDFIGFSNIFEINNLSSVAKYITKYITKDLCSTRKGRRLYFASNGLKKSNRLLDIVVADFHIDYDFVCDFCSVKDISNKDFVYYSNLIKKSFINNY